MWFNGVLTVLWFVAIFPTLLVPQLRSSILYVALLSVWALFATHLGAWIAALVNVKADRLDRANIHKKLDALGEHHGVEEWPA